MQLANCTTCAHAHDHNVYIMQVHYIVQLATYCGPCDEHAVAVLNVREIVGQVPYNLAPTFLEGK